MDLDDQSLSALTTDYMFAYFKFFKTDGQSDDAGLEKLKDIVRKHKDCPIRAFKSIFNKLNEQLEEIEEAKKAQIDSTTKKTAGTDGDKPKIDAQQKEEISEEQLI